MKPFCQVRVSSERVFHRYEVCEPRVGFPTLEPEKSNLSRAECMNTKEVEHLRPQLMPRRRSGGLDRIEVSLPTWEWSGQSNWRRPKAID